MRFSATTTKDRFEELQKNPLLFCKFNLAVWAWTSCDPTITVESHEEDYPQNNIKRRLFVYKNQSPNKCVIESEKKDDDIVEFKIVEFDCNNTADWIIVFNDCLYNLKSGNSRHCHMALIWSLYVSNWSSDTIKDALKSVSSDAAQTCISYISANIFAFSYCKQYDLVDLIKEYNPNIRTIELPDVEDVLRELPSIHNFSIMGFYQKIDYILAFGTKAEDQEYLEKLYKSSTNGFIFYKYWMSHIGIKFFNYNYLEIIYSYVGYTEQLSIIKRYLHDVRIKLIDIDYTLLEKFRDINYQAFVDIRYFVTNPGDNINLVAPMLCDALLTLKKSEGKRIQDFNGILDFAVRHSNKAYPSIDLGVKYIVPTCDGGLMPNPSFLGFIHYALNYSLDESKLTEDNLKKTEDYLINKCAILQYHDCCKADNNKELSSEESSKCKCVIKQKNRLTENGLPKDSILKSACPYFIHEPIKPSVWRKKTESDNILELFIDDISSKEFIKVEDFDQNKLKQSLLSLSKRFPLFKFWNGDAPKSLKEKDVFNHIVLAYYSPITMEIYPNDCMFYSGKKSLLGMWDDKNLTSNQESVEAAQNTEPPIVYNNTFTSLKEMFPNAEIGNDHIKIPYDTTILSEIKAFYHYRHHEYDPSIGYNKTPIWNRELLTPRKIQGIFYCTPKTAESKEKVSNLSFFWCRSDECYYNMLNEQTLDSQGDWREYTLYHASEILGYKLIEVTDKGNVPVEAISNFAGEVRQAEKLYSRLICRDCGHMIFSTRGSLLNGSRYFACENSQCSQFQKDIYLSQCNNCKKGLIDSRDSKKCENGWTICPSCLACCNDNLLDQLIARHRRNGRVPMKLQESEGKGHNNKNIFFCPQCGNQLCDIQIEDTVRYEDGTEKVVITTVLGCPQCHKSYEKEFEKYKSFHI